MRKGGGKAKGSQFEREACRLLSLWISKGTKIDLFWRSAMSGGRATVARGKGIDVRQAGDITAVAPEGHVLTDRFYIECKYYADLALKGFFLRDTGILTNFWKHTQHSAAQRLRDPMLLARENGCPILALFNPGTVALLATGFRPSPGPLWVGRFCEVYKFDDLLAIPFDNLYRAAAT